MALAAREREGDDGVGQQMRVQRRARDAERLGGVRGQHVPRPARRALQLQPRVPVVEGEAHHQVEPLLEHLVAAHEASHLPGSD